jgi:hypothetical protein
MSSYGASMIVRARPTRKIFTVDRARVARASEKNHFALECSRGGV